MNAFILDRYGTADRVQAGDMPDPELRADEWTMRQALASRQQLTSG